jgi:hypothetical protein
MQLSVSSILTPTLAIQVIAQKMPEPVLLSHFETFVKSTLTCLQDDESNVRSAAERMVSILHDLPDTVFMFSRARLHLPMPVATSPAAAERLGSYSTYEESVGGEL